MDAKFLDAILTILGVAITAISPFIAKYYLAASNVAKQTVGENNFNGAKNFMVLAVKTIEQAYPDLTNPDKYAKAVVLLESKFGKNFFGENEVKVLIESAVSDFKGSIDKSTAQAIADAKAQAEADAKKVADAQAVLDAKEAADAKAIADAKALADAQAIVDAKTAADAKAIADAKTLSDAQTISQTIAENTNSDNSTVSNGTSVS